MSDSPFYRWPKGSTVRASAELNVAWRRFLRRGILPIVVPAAMWLGRQPWVIAYAEWDRRHVEPRIPSWLTWWNVMWVTIVLWGAFLTTMALIHG